jgi:hypothetical protein
MDSPFCSVLLPIFQQIGILFRVSAIFYPVFSSMLSQNRRSLRRHPERSEDATGGSKLITDILDDAGKTKAHFHREGFENFWINELRLFGRTSPREVNKHRLKNLDCGFQLWNTYEIGLGFFGLDFQLKLLQSPLDTFDFRLVTHF